MKKYKLNFPGIILKVFRLPVRLILFFIIIFFPVYFILKYGARILKTSDYLKIKDVVVRGTGIADLSYLKGENIFDVGLKRESEYTASRYPEYRAIRLIRLFPNRIIIDFVKREPLGIIKLYRNFCVDKEGILFNVPEQAQDDLALILGLETRIFAPRHGRKYNSVELTLALSIIKEIKSNAGLKDYKVKKVDVANAAGASVFILDDLQIKVGQDNIREKIGILPSLLMQSKNDLANIKYIDLRFKEPVIKFKDK